jgi:hypothetical protein
MNILDTFRSACFQVTVLSPEGEKRRTREQLTVEASIGKRGLSIMSRGAGVISRDEECEGRLLGTHSSIRSQSAG